MKTTTKVVTDWGYRNGSEVRSGDILVRQVDGLVCHPSTSFELLSVDRMPMTRAGDTFSAVVLNRGTDETYVSTFGDRSILSVVTGVSVIEVPIS